MNMDLLSAFDYSWSGGSNFMNFFYCVSGLFLPLFVLSSSFYWQMSCREWAVVMLIRKYIKSFTMDKSISIMGGGSQLMMGLFFVLMSLSFASLMPFTYPLSHHLSITASMSFPFWLGTVLMYFNLNWMSFLSKMSIQGSFLLSLFYQGVEVVTIGLRGLTLCLRMSMNMLVSLIFAKIFFSYAEGMFMMSWGWVGYSFMFVLAILYYGAEWMIMLIQCSLFVVLLISYVDESVMSAVGEVNYKSVSRRV